MRRILPALFCLFLLAAPALAGDLSGLFPDAVGDMPRVQLATGQDAQAEVDRLHGKALEAEASGVARYARGDERPAEVWVSRVSSEAEARRQTGLMVHKMFENPQSPFQNPGRINHGDTAVYRFTGMGQVHLIWYSGDLVWWVSASPADETAFLEAFCL
ncbi:hypothetical protein [Desulfovibrio sp. Fe33]|uniref:hypothetical protein n=1 Tax=Desulfovibrio sp. Fe33 TaxID=3020842 RepID=UPI00234D1C53|nr:hypothetical protein [Desulfovibrio sp. Fe33]